MAGCASQNGTDQQRRESTVSHSPRLFKDHRSTDDRSGPYPVSNSLQALAQRNNPHCNPLPCCVSFYPKGITLQHKVPAGLDRKETEVYRQLDPGRLPRHIAIIMDGNGRWAKRRHMPRVAGHRAGVAAVRSTVETAARVGIQAITLYAFSEENWKKRPKSEVDFLMRLLSRYLKAEVPTLNENNVRLEYIGRQHELPEDVQDRMTWARDSTAHNTSTTDRTLRRPLRSPRRPHTAAAIAEQSQ